MAQAPAAGGGNSIFSFFQSKAQGKPDAGKQPGNQPGAGGQQQQQQQQQDNNNKGQQSGESNQLPNNPLDAYAKLWENADDKADKAPAFNVDGKVINGRADALDFMYGLPDDLQQEVSEKFGDNAETLGKLLNHIGRRAYSTTLSDSMNLSDKYIDMRSKFEKSHLGQDVRKQMVMSTLDAHEAAKKHPIVRETLRMIGERVARLHPDASPQEVQEMSVKFFTDMNGAINPQPDNQQIQQDAAKAPGGEEFDWGGYLKGDATPARRS